MVNGPFNLNFEKKHFISYVECVVCAHINSRIASGDFSLSRQNNKLIGVEDLKGGSRTKPLNLARQASAYVIYNHPITRGISTTENGLGGHFNRGHASVSRWVRIGRHFDGRNYMQSSIINHLKKRLVADGYGWW